jgi:hypothetical protein
LLDFKVSLVNVVSKELLDKWDLLDLKEFQDLSDPQVNMDLWVPPVLVVMLDAKENLDPTVIACTISTLFPALFLQFPDHLSASTLSLLFLLPWNTTAEWKSKLSPVELQEPLEVLHSLFLFKMGLLLPPLI